MPNLKELYRLKEKYSNTYASNIRKEDVKVLLESFNPSHFQSGQERNRGGVLNKSFSFPHFKANDYIDYFYERKKAQVVLLFIDVTAFSQKFLDKSSDELVLYLDQYYSRVIPLINKYGGEIEKIMGDGIICVFGAPFLDEDKETIHNYAYNCSKEIIRTLYGTDFSVKVALHYGEIMYYQNPTSEYFEYTMIGNALTQLFRLEAISEANSVNFFGTTYIDGLVKDVIAGNNHTIFDTILANWLYANAKPVELTGVSYRELRHVRYDPDFL